MSVSEQTTVNSSTGNGVTTVFPYTFKILNQADIEVTVDGVVKTLTTDYSVSGVGDDAGGDVTFVTAPADQATVVRRRNMAFVRTTDYQYQGELPNDVLNADQDAPVLMIQQLAADIARALQVPWYEIGSDMTLPAKAARLDKLLGFNVITGAPEASTFTMTQVASVIAAVYAAAAGPLDALSFLQAGTGAVSRSAQAKLREVAVSVKDFGAVGDGVADDTAAIQAAIDYTMLQGGRQRVIAPAGIYRITDTIHLGYGSGSFNAVVFEGEGYRFRAESGFNGTAFLVDFSDRPAFNLQGARGSVLRGVAIKGKNFDWVLNNSLGAFAGSVIDDTAAANWVDPTLAATADTRYAPYAAITVDAYSGVKPATSYPNVNYPASLGPVAQYGKAFSSDILIENVYICGFVAGVVIQPCDADGNGDFTVLRRVHIEAAKYGISIGNTQSRNVDIDNVKLTRVFKGLTNNQHGKQQGKYSGTINNLSVGSCIHLFDFGSSSVFGPLTFLQLYCESTWRLGDISATASSETSIIFQSCQFFLSGQNDTRGVPATVLGGAAQNIDVQFIGCSFSQFPSVLPLIQSGVRLTGTTLIPGTRTGASALASEYLAAAHNALAGGLVLPTLTSPPDQRIKFLRFSLDTLASVNATFCQAGYKNGDRAHCIPHYVWSAQAVNETYGDNVVTPRRVSVVSKASLSACSLSGKTLTVQFASRADYQFALYGPDNGDVLYDDQTGMVFFVRSRTATTITAEAQNNYKSDGGGGYTTVTAFSTSSGNLYFISSRVYTPASYLRGDTTAGNPTITNCANDVGTAAYDAHIGVDDYYYVFDTQDNVQTPTASARVSARDQAAGTITLAGNLGRSQTRRRLAIFARKPPANA